MYDDYDDDSDEDWDRPIFCSFEFEEININRDYCCKIQNEEIKTCGDIKFNPICHHLENPYQQSEEDLYYKDSDVRIMKFEKCTFLHFPSGLTKNFPNIHTLRINYTDLDDSKLFGLMHASGLENLKELDLSYNKITKLHAGLLKKFERLRVSSLETFSLEGNDLIHIDPIVVVCLDQIGCVNLNGKTKEFRYGSYKNDKQQAKNRNQMKKNIFDAFFGTGNEDEAARYLNTIFSENKRMREQRESVKKLKQQVEALTLENEKLRKEDEQMKKLKDENVELRMIAAKELEFLDTENCCMIDDKKIKIFDSEFHVHELLLASKGATLGEMLRNNSDCENLNVVDFSIKTVGKVLKFIYASEMAHGNDENEANFLHLFVVAGRMKSEQLKNFAADKIINIINSENALEILEVSNKYGHDGLRRKALREVKKKYPNVKLDDDWAGDEGKISKIIDLIKKMRQLEAEFECSME